MPIFYLTLAWLAVRAGLKLGRLGDFNYLAGGMLFFSIVSSLLALAQWLGLSGLGTYLADLPAGGRPFGNLSQPNNLAHVCFIGLAAAAWFFERGMIGRLAAAVLIVVIGFGLVASGSRVAWLQIIGAVLFLVAMQKRLDSKKLLNFMLMALLLCVLLRLAFPVLAKLVLLWDPRSLAEQADPGLRVEMWQMAWHSLTLQPWLGFGWMQINSAQQLVAHQFPNHHEHFEHSHNLVLDLFLWNGAVIGLIACGLLCSWLIGRLRSINHREGLVSAAMLIGMLAHAMVEYPLDYAYLLLPLGMLMGVMEAQHVPSAPLEKPGRDWATIALMAACLLFFLKLSTEYLSAEIRMRDTRLESFGIGPTPPQPGLDGYVLLDHLDHYMDFIGTPATQGMKPEALEAMQAIARRFGYAPVLMRYALALGLNGKSKEAIDTLELLCHMHAPQRCREAADGWSGARLRWPFLPAWHPTSADSRR